MDTYTKKYKLFILTVGLGLLLVVSGVLSEEMPKKVIFIEGYGDEEIGIESFKDIGSSNFASAMRQEGYLVEKTSTANGLSLEGFKVVVINRPYKTIPGPEINKIILFVKNGGGIFLIGDYYKWKIDPVINPLSSQLGIGFNGNILAEPIENTKDDVHNILVKDFSSHPISAGLEVVGYFGGGYLTTPSENIVASTTKESWIDINDDGQRNGNNEPFNKFTVIAATEVGNGKAVAIGDGTLFENLNFNNYDGRKLAINSIKWLAGDIAQESKRAVGTSMGMSSGLSSVYKYSSLYIALLIIITLLFTFNAKESKKEFTEGWKQFVSGFLIGGILGGLIESGNLPYFSSIVGGGIGGFLSAKNFTSNSHVIGAFAGGYSAIIGVLIGYIISGKIGFSFITTNPLNSIGVSLFFGVISGAIFGISKKENKS